MNAVEIQSLVGLGITVLIVYRFARRELKERTVHLRSLWIRPVLLIALTAYLIALSVRLDPLGNGEMLASLVVGAALGIAVGVAVVRNTNFAPAGVANAVHVRGNRITFGIWIGALALRFVVRYTVPHGTDPRTQLPLNCGMVLMAAVAFVVIAIAFAVEIRRHAATAFVSIKAR
jgi:hypothetical protein